LALGGNLEPNIKKQGVKLGFYPMALGGIKETLYLIFAFDDSGNIHFYLSVRFRVYEKLMEFLLLRISFLVDVELS
jgi:hypothetical protein